MPESNPFIVPSNEVNPYAAPSAASHPIGAPATSVGIWREGKTLVMHKQASLPDVCIKSNETTDGYRLKRKLSWHHPLIASTILISPLIYVILAVVLSKRATITIGLTDTWRKKRIQRIMTAWSGVLMGLIGGIAGLAMINPNGNSSLGGWLALGGLLMIIVMGIYGIVAARLISPKKIDAQYIYIKGAHPEFLARFPDIAQV